MMTDPKIVDAIFKQLELVSIYAHDIAAEKQRTDT